MAGARAFDVLRRVLRGERVQAVIFPEPAFARLFSALTNMQALPSPIDLAVLVRHVLRYQGLQQSHGEPVRLLVPRVDGWPTFDQWNRVGVTAEPTNGGFWVSAQPWCPSWLPNVGNDGVDAAAAQAPERRSLNTTSGDPFLAELTRQQYKSYQSAGQRAAMHAALTTPPGATLLICLPTGEGKSLIFQAIAQYGFGDGESSAVTLVVTPTVALALDHDRAVNDLWPADESRAYIGGNTLANQRLVERISDGTQDLCFASPEAVCGPLRPALMRAARAGRLRALVVDEAHLVDAWGGNFRSEFQLLSGIRHDLLREQGSVSALRTVLLSATVTTQAESTLRTLFGANIDGSPGQYAVSASVRLRPEIDYWVAPICREAERRERVIEAVYHLPRPAILYTTEVKDADYWYDMLRQMDFRRIACVTGETKNAQREVVISGWRAGAVDLVVATSAFGLGINNLHVRTVIHACIPESLDRFYQEVGRGGRDGRASISLLIPAEYDHVAADGLSKPRYITVERGFQRWQAMFHHRDTKPVGEREVQLRVDIPPGVGEHDIDMVSGQNTTWNMRTLTLMATTNLITLLRAGNTSTSDNSPAGSDADVATDPMSADAFGSSASLPNKSGNSNSRRSVIPRSSRVREMYQTVRILNPHHMERDTWEQVVEPQRTARERASKQSYRRMLAFLKQQQCAADILAPQYELRMVQAVSGDGMLESESARVYVSEVQVARACGGCGHCRASGRAPYSDSPIVTRYPWPPLPAPHALVDQTNRLVIYYNPETHFNGHISGQQRRDQRKLADFLRHYHIRNVIVLPGFALNRATVQEHVDRWPIFWSESLTASQLPPGAALVMVPTGFRLTVVQLAPQLSNHARIFLLPDGFEDPVRPGIPLRRTYSDREIDWKVL